MASKADAQLKICNDIETINQLHKKLLLFTVIFALVGDDLGITTSSSA